MSFIKEILKGKKAGFTIIEILMVMAIVGTIFTIQAPLLLKYMKVNRNEIVTSRDEFYVNEAFMIMKSQINNAKYIKISDNTIYLKRHDNMGWDYMKLGSGSNIVLVYGYTRFQTVNNILRDVSNFKVYERRNLCYISIKTKRGNVYDKCFGISSKSVKEDS